MFVAATASEASTAFTVAGQGGALVLVEEYVSGSDYRALVVGSRVVAAELSPAQFPAVLDRDPVIRYFTVSAGNPVVADHLRDGGVAYLLDDGELVEAKGATRCTLASRREVPQCWDGEAGFMVANVLAAAARALGTIAQEIGDALPAFEPSRDSPGRLDVFTVGEVPVVLDYAHNPAAR